MLIQLLVQIIYILFPILLYFSLLKNNVLLKKYTPTILGLLCALSIYLCMTYPISFVTGNILDLRNIPWIISFLYGGFHVGISVTLFMFVFRIFLGGMGMYAVFIAYSISTILLIIFFKNYAKYHYKKRLKFSLLLTFVNSLIVVLSSHFIFQFNIEDMLTFYIFFIILHLVTMLIVIYLIEIFHENERLQIELHRSEKLNVVGQMAASVAHEIRNPMTTVYGFLQLLSTDNSTPEEHKKHFQIMKEELDRAENIISEYLTLAKPAVDKLEKIDLKKQIEQINHSLLSFSTMHGVNLQYKLSENEDYYIKGSSQKIQQVLVNIIKNAIEVSSKNSIVYILISKHNKTVQISIKDTGYGMSKEEMKSLGTPFYSLKENGTGLGLTVCYRIINAMGGRIEVESEKNIGTNFNILIPEYKA